MIMDDAVTMVQVLADLMAEKNGEVAGDYYDGDIMMCGKCRTPKRCRKEYHGVTMYLPVSCLCRKQAAEKETKYRTEVERIARTAELKRASMMDSRLYSSTFAAAEGSENDKSMKMCRRYADKFREMLADGRGLLLFGTVGTGKTYAAAAIANEIMESGFSAVMLSLVQVVNSGTDSFEDCIRNADLLIFDDLGSERTTDYALERVYNAVDIRYRTNKPVVYTTNLPLDTLKNPDDIRFARIYDRVLERCFPIQFVGKSRRKTAARDGFEKMKEMLDD